MIAYDVNEDGSRGTQYVAGTITAVCEASAILCRRLANRALQEQFEAKQRDDPRNWSQLRQSFEAFRAIKQLQALEPERIPESLVRESIAREQGIPPEQVTAKQIRLEVAGLLPFYPHIELVPPPSRNMAANGNDARGRRELRDSYLSQFPEEKLKIRDICWAAGQHYREWKRWLAGQLKDGSTGDVAFRRVLTSGKRPQELKKQPRPKAWQ